MCAYNMHTVDIRFNGMGAYRKVFIDEAISDLANWLLYHSIHANNDRYTLYMYIHVLPVATVAASLIPPANSSREAPL